MTAFVVSGQIDTVISKLGGGGLKIVNTVFYCSGTNYGATQININPLAKVFVTIPTVLNTGVSSGMVGATVVASGNAVSITPVSPVNGAYVQLTSIGV